MKKLKYGSKGDEVRRIQRILSLAEDGIFGVVTLEAVKDFQNSRRLTPDGIVGEKTWAELLKVEERQTGSVSTASGSEGSILSKLKVSKRKIREIVVHCTATKAGQKVEVKDIIGWHKARGFKTIGYHYVVYLDGSIHLGRDVDTIGAHAVDHNAHSIGVVYVGGLDSKGKPDDTRTEKQKASLEMLLKKLRHIYPKAKILGHRDTSPDKNGNGLIEKWEWLKDCPCFDAKREYERL